MFINTACRPSRWCSRQGHLHMGMMVIISLQRWLMVNVMQYCKMFRKKGSSALICPCYPSFQAKPHTGHQKCKWWGIIPLPPGTVGQYQPLALDLVSLVQAWMLQAGGYLGAQAIQIRATSNLINIYWQITSSYYNHHSIHHGYGSNGHS